MVSVESSKGTVLSRHERDFRDSVDAPLSLEEIVALLRGEGDGDDRARQHAIACYLSAGDGWRDAVKQLGGTFAPKGQELRERKPD